MPSRFLSSFARSLLTTLALALVVVGCDKKMPEAECDKLRADSFELINKGQQCSTDTDCQQSAWPGCEKPISHATAEKIKPMSEKYKAGLCTEPKSTCRPPPEVYCKQGLCVHREKGAPAAQPGTDEIQIQ
jgi:hypothetical protein